MAGGYVECRIDGGCFHNDTGSRGLIERPCNKYYDLAEPAEDPESEPYPVEFARLYQRYFNERYQTYGRLAHFHVYFSSQNSSSETARADAVDNYRKLNPFAVLVFDQQSRKGQAYTEVMASKGVLNFGGSSERRAETFSRYRGLLWGYGASLEYHVRQFVDHVCTKVVGRPVSIGDPTRHGQPRRFGLLRPPDGFPSENEFASQAKRGIEACGGRFVAEGTTNNAGGINPVPNEKDPATMAAFADAGVTTIIYPQIFETSITTTAGNINYLPEWILIGAPETADIVFGKYQDQDVFRHAWVIANQALEGPRRTAPCVAALKESEPSFAFQDTSLPCFVYDDIRQLFTGIQVAGPKLNAESLDKGFHAIPAKPSTNPSEVSCFYEPNDYTCVKDSIAMWWDPDATSPYSSAPGCWRVAEGGNRHLPGDWPATNIDAERSRSADPCNGFTTGLYLDPAPGPESPTTQ